jgi:hypothetical protein
MGGCHIVCDPLPVNSFSFHSTELKKKLPNINRGKINPELSVSELFSQGDLVRCFKTAVLWAILGLT